MDQPPVALARPSQGLRISFGEAQRLWRQRSPALARERALWACVAVIGLSLLSAYVMVLRDAVHSGEEARTGLAQQNRSPAQARVQVAAPTGESWRAAPTPR